MSLSAHERGPRVGRPSQLSNKANNPWNHGPRGLREIVKATTFRIFTGDREGHGLVGPPNFRTKRTTRGTTVPVASGRLKYLPLSGSSRGAVRASDCNWSVTASRQQRRNAEFLTFLLYLDVFTNSFYRHAMQNVV